MRLFRDLILPCLSVIIGCQQADQVTQKVPELIILDTDMGSDCDDVGALALLHQYAKSGEVEILAVIYSSGAVPYGAGVVDAINAYYGKPDLPIGADHGLEFGDPVDKMSAEKLAKDTVAFGNDVVHNLDASEQTWLSREILADQEDQSVTYVTIGHTKGLYDLWASKGDSLSPLSGRTLLQRKLKRWVALGALNAYDRPEGVFSQDWNFFRNGTAKYTALLVNELDVPSYFIDAGSTVMTGSSLIPTPSGNIVRTAYRDWLWNVFNHTMEQQRPSWDLAAVFFAAEGYGDFLTKGEEGYLSFDSLQGSRWIPGESHRPHHYIRQKPGTDETFADYLNQKISSVPSF